MGTLDLIIVFFMCTFHICSSLMGIQPQKQVLSYLFTHQGRFTTTTGHFTCLAQCSLTLPRRALKVEMTTHNQLDSQEDWLIIMFVCKIIHRLPFEEAIVMTSHDQHICHQLLRCSTYDILCISGSYFLFHFNLLYFSVSIIGEERKKMKQKTKGNEKGKAKTLGSKFWQMASALRITEAARFFAYFSQFAITSS